MPRSGRRVKVEWALLAALALVALAADLATKAWVRGYFAGHPPLVLIPGLLEFTYAENTAIAFSLLHQLPDALRARLVFGLAGVAFAAVLALAWKWRRAPLALRIPLAIIVAGAVGNLHDRILRGYVIDFIHFHYRAFHFPVFNLADSLVCVGVGALFLSGGRAGAADGSAAARERAA